MIAEHAAFVELTAPHQARCCSHDALCAVLPVVKGPGMRLGTAAGIFLGPH